MTEPRKLPEWMFRQQKGAVKSSSFFIFSGKIIFYQTFVDVAAACDEILKLIESGDITILGFDAEWPVFAGNKSGKLALIQICLNDNTCYLLHVYKFRALPASFVRLLKHPVVQLVGINIKNDIWKLGRDFNFRVQDIVDNNCVDIAVLARTVLKTTELWNLKTLVNYLLKKDISKCELVRKSGWNHTNLTEKQKTYAATDAYVSLLCYNELKNKYKN